MAWGVVWTFWHAIAATVVTYEKNRDVYFGDRKAMVVAVLRVGRVDEDDGRARVGVRHDHQVGALALCSRERLRVGERVEGREAREEPLRRRRVERLRFWWWRRRGLVY